MLQVLLAHDGRRLQADPSTFPSLDAFRNWVAKNSTVLAKDHIALTPSGKQVRFAALSTETEIIVYDGRIFQSSPGPSKPQTFDIPFPPKYHATKPPDTIADQNDLQAWKNLFMERRSWALKIVNDCQAMSEQATQRYEELEVITRGVDAAVLNLEKHVKTLDQKNADVQNWAAEISREQELAGGNWNDSIQWLRNIPVDPEIVSFITGRNSTGDRAASLEDLVDIEETKKAIKVINKISTDLGKNGAGVGTKVDTIMAQMDMLFDKVERSPARTAIEQAREPTHLMQDIEPIARKVSNDYENVLSYQDSAKSISQASKSALLHTKNFLPSLIKRSAEMYDILKQVSEIRNQVAAEAVDSMRDIAALTTMVGEANTQFGALNLGTASEEAFAMVSILNTLPITYASLVAEAVRRREWSEKIRSDSSTLANEMAAFQDEEGKRRRRWQKNVGLELWGERTEPQVMGLEVNLQGEEEQWPQARREDLEEFIHAVQAQGGHAPIVTELSKILDELNQPTKQQTKRAKAFKAGSMHEAALGKSGLLIRGDDESIRVLQEEKQKTESKLKSAESRVRRLEDLLHRQSHINRTSTGNIFQLPGTPVSDFPPHGLPISSPRPEEMSRRSSVSSRRFSANHGAEEKALQQKVLLLEADLTAERDRSSGLQHQIFAGKTATTELQGQIDEANSMKNDLMGNFEAQQREFIEERKSLENEIKRLKTKLEELEDEMDRYLGSRENERVSVDDRVRSLQDELEKIRKENIAETQKAQGQIEFLRNEAQLQRDANDNLEKEMQKLRTEHREVENRAQTAEALVDQQSLMLLDLHQQLLPRTTAPTDLTVFADQLASTITDLVERLASATSAVTIATTQRDTAEEAVLLHKKEVSESQKRVEGMEKELSEAHNALAAEKARFEALEAELDDERMQLSGLRKKISDGETGSEALRVRLEEEEKKVTNMSEDLATRFSRVGALEEELRSFQDKYRSSQAKHEKLLARFEARTTHTKELSQRVYMQNDRLCRLLDRLSYSVTREGGAMTIQRIPRPDRSIINANDSSDPGTAMRRSISGALSRKSMIDSGDLDLLNWTDNEDPDTEVEKYNAYLDGIGSFDIDQFAEAITKRVKDMEYTAKKYNKDARSYREKSHMAQKEAHEKIAFKNFKEGDLALFLPTRNQTTGAWAAFNIGAPHYFLREQDSHKLRSRDWLLARIHKIHDRVVDLSKSMSSTHPNASDGRSFGEASNGGDSFEDDNPFDLSDGLRWYLIDAAEEKPGAPATPGLGKSTVASAHIDATGDFRRSKKSSSGGVEGLNKTLSKSLESRRSSTNSKKGVPGINGLLKSGVNTGDNASLKSNSTAQVTGETSDAQIIRAKDVAGAADKKQNAEVGNHQIDDLMGP